MIKKALKLVEDLNRITREDEENFAEVDLDDDFSILSVGNNANREDTAGVGGVVEQLFLLSQTQSSSSSVRMAVNQHSLYALDLLLICNLTQAVLDYEASSAPSFLFIQDKYFLSNLFGVLNRLLDKKYDLRLSQFVDKQIEASRVSGPTQTGKADDRPIKLGNNSYI